MGLSARRSSRNKNRNTDSTIARISADSKIEVGDHRHIATLLIADEETAGVKTWVGAGFEF